jgi:capsular exopolysaccharide synthesis family protein
MGEIADALRRANAQKELESRREAEPEAPASPATDEREPEPKERPYTAAMDLIQSFDQVEADAEPDEDRVVALDLGHDGGPNSQARAVLASQKGGVAEAFRHFALRVSRELALLGNHVLLVVSSVQGEGKTTIACNLALALATVGGHKKTALVDMDLRRPALGRYLGASPTVGIESVIKGTARLEEARVTTNFRSLDIYPVKRPVQNPHEFLGGDAVANLFEQLRKDYYTVIVDTPPALIVPDVELILPFAGGCINVIRARTTRVDAFQQLLDLLPREKHLGVFLNETRRPRLGKKYNDYYFAEGFDEDDDPDQK